MVDFAKILEEQRARMTPEQLARVEAREPAEAAYETTAATLTGYFGREGTSRTAPPRPAARPVLPNGTVPKIPTRSAMEAAARPAEPERPTIRTWEAPVKVRIEDYTGNDGVTHESVRFIGAVTGWEAFRLDEHFIRVVEGTDGRPAHDRLCLCAGTAGKYDSCHVSREELASYLREMRPALFAAAGPSGP